MNYEIDRLTKAEIVELLTDFDDKAFELITNKANEIKISHYGNAVFVRGLIEFTNYCKNNCYYCGIRRDNKKVERYRLLKSDILACCEAGYNLGYRTFVLQGGEDAYYTDDIMADIIKAIKQGYSDCALTLSIGEKPYDSYKRYFDAGADRYLLRHETATEQHYNKLHPASMSLQSRKECLYALKQIGFQVGAGFMVGSPYQTIENIAEDLLFLKQLQPEMVGIGPFLPSQDTPFGEHKSGDIKLTLLLIALTRILLPKALIPATTAVGTLDPTGREKALKAGANVVMPNLSPIGVRKKYLLYDNKICTGEEAAECKACLENRIKTAGFEMDYSRGDHLDAHR